MKRYRSVGVRPLLPQRTLDYLARGAAEGQRNAELFDAACQFRDAGIAAEEAETQLDRTGHAGRFERSRGAHRHPFSVHAHAT